MCRFGCAPTIPSRTPGDEESLRLARPLLRQGDSGLAVLLSSGSSTAARSLLSSGSSTPYGCPPDQEPAPADAPGQRCWLRQQSEASCCNISLDLDCHARPSLKCDAARD